MTHALEIGMPHRETANGPLMVVQGFETMRNAEYAYCRWDENGKKYVGLILVSKLHAVPMEELLGDGYCV